MTIGRKITLSFSAPIALTILMVAISLVNIRLMSRTVTRLGRQSLPGISSVGNLSGIAKDIRGGIRQHITAATDTGKVNADADLDRLQQRLQAEIHDYEETISSTRERRLFERIRPAFEDLLRTMPAIRPLSLQGKTPQALAIFFSRTLPAYQRTQQAIEVLIRFKKDEGMRNAAGAQATARHAELWASALLLAAVMGCGVIVHLRRLLKPLKELIRFTVRVGGGDLSAVAPVRTSDEIGELTAAFNDMVTRLSASQQRLDERTVQLEKSNAELRESQERFQLAVDGAKDGIWDWDLRTQCVYYSPRWKSMLGHTGSEIHNHIEEWHSRIHPDDRERVKAELAAHFRGDVLNFESEHRMLRKDGAYRWMLTRAQAVRLPDGTVSRMAGSQTDVTDNKVLDALTGLPNRILFKDKLALSIERSRRNPGYRFAVFFLDLDGFKLINDTLGHKIGDLLLSGIAQRVKSCVRAGDYVARPFASSTIARLGGDEFALLLEDIESPENAKAAAERVLQALHAPFDLEGHHVFASASIGIALGRGGDQKPDDLLQDADLAMYSAKTRGKARYQLFDDKMRESAMARLEMEVDLRRAIEDGELVVHYQPKVSLRDESTLDFEALVRWRHPTQGLIPPARFIPLAEETGLIVPIGKWVLRVACRQAAQWRLGYPDGPPVTVGVNISPRQFREPDLLEQIAGALREANLPPDALDLEVTESCIMDDPEAALSIFSRLKEIGVSLSMDDFGTGYSALNYLHKFPFDTLKIDRSFVEHMQLDHESAEIVSAVIDLGNRLGMRVLAEGVETSEQLDRLRTLGCGYGQGYYFAKPMDAGRAEELIGKQAVGLCSPIPEPVNHPAFS